MSRTFVQNVMGMKPGYMKTAFTGKDSRKEDHQLHVPIATASIISFHRKIPILRHIRQMYPETCAKCHENQTKMQALYYGIRTDRFDTYKKSFHYKSYVGGGRLLASCSDCHENHDTRQESDPKSAINPANLPSTCGKSGCHPGANNVFIYWR